MSTYTFDNDPFADPTIKAAANQNTNNIASEFEDYNPFANQTTRNVDPFSPPMTNATTTPTAAILSPTNMNQQPTMTQNQISNNFNSGNTMTAEQLRQRQEELDRKAAELAAREAELQRAQRIGGVRENNFPPLPAFFPCKPCFFQDINVEIEVNFQKIVFQCYQLWLFYVVTLTVNFIGCFFALIEGVANSGGMFSFALITLLIFTPLSFVCWFRPLYKAFRDDSSFNFMVFFFVFFCQLVLAAVWALGIPGSGGLGLIMTIKFFSSSYSIWFRLVTMLCTIVLAFYALASFFVLIKVHGIYHKSDLSIQKAQAEFTSKVLSNERVQQMASNAAQTAARQAMNQAFSQPSQQNNTSNEFRY